MVRRSDSVWQWARERLAVPATVVATLTFAVVHDFVGRDGDPAPWVLVFDVILVLPLFLRRRWPWATFLAVAALALLQWLAGVFAAGDVAVLVALYSVGAHARREAVVAAAVISQVGVVLAVARWAPPGQVVTTALGMTGTVTAAWVIGVYVRTRRVYIASVLERAATAERARDQQALLATAAERSRISREMHDIVAHSLSVIIALNDGAAASVRSSPVEAEEAVRLAATLGRQSLGEVRRLLSADHEDATTDRVPAPGLAQLDDLAASVRAAGLAVDLTMEGRPVDVPASAQLTIYRMVQEALTNVLKHAPEARRAVVTVHYAADEIDVEVVNDGPAGAALPTPSAHPGQGLNGMRERVGMFSGTIEAAPRLGGGWRVASRLLLDKPVTP
ncbi:sensor histidine kinase [Nocardioides sp. Iso805N]|uniref:sensor histidine kinase n=1 Tax=Nocardioides sp. Iso805N TaxID=1283287 RepID=UPI00036E8596|nr:histidine kinase [Nocardioides sp. Iso805N]